MAEAGSNGRKVESDAARQLLAAARERFAVAATELLLPDSARLTEWQRLTASQLLSRLLTGIEEDMRLRLLRHFPPEGALHAALSSAHVAIAVPILERAGALTQTDLMMFLVRRVEEHRFWRRHEVAREEYLHALLTDADEEIAAETMSYVIARGRRFDRFQEPTLVDVELPAEMQHRLIWMIAAALRHYMVEHHGAASVDAAIETAAGEMIGGYDESERIEARAEALVRRLHRKGRIDGHALECFVGGGLPTLFVAALGLMCGMTQDAVWEVIADPRRRGLVLMLRAADIPRSSAGAVIHDLAAASTRFSASEGDDAAEQLEYYDTLDVQSAREILRLWRADPAYRAFVAQLSTRGRPAASA
jgi:hypothetical protein